MSNKRRIRIAYISGPISGDSDYYEKFEIAYTSLLEADYIVLKPTILPIGLSFEKYMKIDLAMVEAADDIFFLPGWENSQGATTERAAALKFEKTIYEYDIGSECSGRIGRTSND